MALLPTEPTRRCTDLSAFNFVVYGPPKIGKTTLASRFPASLFIATEDGQNSLECFRVGVDSWPGFLAVAAELMEGNHAFQTIIVDTVDNLWGLCQRFICEKKGVEHESELAYGLGAELIRTEFFRALTKLSMLPYGLVLISHAVTKEVTTRTGTTHRVVPSFREREQGRLLGMADFILYCDLMPVPGADGKPQVQRVIRTKTSENYIAGDRTGRLPDPLPLDFDVFKREFDLAASAHAAGSQPTPEKKPAAGPAETRKSK